MARWGDEKTLYFINLYRQRECLWNTRSPLYKNKIAREYAYKSILQSFKDKHLDVKSVKTKIKNLRSVYHTELKKVKDTSRCGSDGSIYKPSLSWFNEMHAFLGDSAEERVEPASTAKASVDTEVETQDTSEENNASLSKQDTSVDHIKIEATLESNLDPLRDTQPDDQVLSNSKPCNIILRPSSSDQHHVKTNKRKAFSRNRPHVDNSVLSALQRLENRVCHVVNSTQLAHTSHSQHEDEFHMFALSVAAQLRQLPLHIAMSTQSKIQNILSEARLSSIFSKTLASPSLSIKTEDTSI